MTKPVVTATTLVTEDGVPIDAAHLPGPGDLAIVVAPGFTLSWQRPNVWRIANRFNRMAGVVIFDFRGHGRSGGLSTLGDREIKDLDVAVAYARELGYRRIAVVGFSMGASIVLRHAGLIGGVAGAVSRSGPRRRAYPRTGRWPPRPAARESRPRAPPRKPPRPTRPLSRPDPAVRGPSCFSVPSGFLSFFNACHGPLVRPPALRSALVKALDQGCQGKGVA